MQSPLTFVLVGSLVLFVIIYGVARSGAGARTAIVTLMALAPFLLCTGLYVLTIQAILTSVLCLIVGRFSKKRSATLMAMLAGVAASYGFVFLLSRPWLRERSELRDEFPLVSMDDRLGYEKSPDGHSADGKTVGAVPKLSADVNLRLKERERSLEQQLELPYPMSRVDTLKLLHSRKRDEFIRASGFGVARLSVPPVQRERIALPDVNSIPLPLAPPDEPLDTGGTPLAGQDGPQRDATSPSDRDLLRMHSNGERDFLDRQRMGYIRSRREVAGFEPHRFQRLPEVPADKYDKDKDKEQEWKLTRLELISLLRHKSPRVYVSKELPRMDKLKQAPTRALDGFESSALPQLRTERDVVVKTELNHIRMLGSLRASKNCLQCHSVPRGTLLGAFSYELRRIKPVREPAKSKLVTSLPAVSPRSRRP